MRFERTYIASLLMLSLAALACSTLIPAPTGTPVPTPTPNHTPTPTEPRTNTPAPTNTPRPTRTLTPVPQPGDVLLRDTFDNNAYNWGINRDADWVSQLSDGVLSMQVTRKDYFYFSNPRGVFIDTDMTFDVTFVDGQASNTMMGAQCRKRPDNTFYMFLITAHGNFIVTKYDNAWTKLIEWTASNAILTGTSTNTLRVICAADVLQFWVNGVLLADLRDTSYTQGQVGLVVGTFTQQAAPISIASFDNLTVALPDTAALTAGGSSGVP